MIRRTNNLTVQICCLVLAIILGSVASAQIISNFNKRTATGQDLELLRSDVRAQKDEIMRLNFHLSPEEAEKFWPLYRDHELELSKIWDKRQEVYTRFVQNYRQLSDDEADAIVEATLDTDYKMTKLRKRYYYKIKRSVSASVATRFFQLDRRINNLIEIQIAESLPLANY